MLFFVRYSIIDFSQLQRKNDVQTSVYQNVIAHSRSMFETWRSVVRLVCNSILIFHVRITQKEISKSFTINFSHFRACIDANDIIAEYLQNPKTCYMGYFCK